jgi:hypothetical protein
MSRMTAPKRKPSNASKSVISGPSREHRGCGSARRRCAPATQSRTRAVGVPSARVLLLDHLVCGALRGECDDPISQLLAVPRGQAVAIGEDPHLLNATDEAVAS